MKFIKYAVGLVIALSVIPMVVVAVTKLDEPRLKTVEFEVVDVDNDTITFSENTYNIIHSLTVDDGFDISNVITIKLNGVELENGYLTYNNGLYGLSSDDGNDWDYLGENNEVISFGYQATIGDKWEMTFEVPSPTPPLIKLLVGFAPLLFVGGILLFMLNKRKFD